MPASLACQKLVHAARIDRVVIAHHHNRGGVILGAEVADELQELIQRHAGFQCALSGQLNGLAVGHRVGEGQAQLDDVHTGCGQAFDDL